MPSRGGVFGTHGQSKQIREHRHLFAEGAEAVQGEVHRRASRRLPHELPGNPGEVSGEEHPDPPAALLSSGHELWVVRQAAAAPSNSCRRR